MTIHVRIATVVTVVAMLFATTHAQRPTPPQSFQVVEMLPGVVEPADQVTLSAPFDGVLMSIDVSEGQQVALGETVALMDNRVASASLKLAEQQVNDATVRLSESQLDSATRYERRVTEAHENQAASDVELDNARFAREQAKQRVEQVKNQQAAALASWELEQARLETHFIRSPFAGQVIRVEAKPGEALNRAAKVLTVANLTSLEVELQIPLKWFRKLTVGQSCWLVAAAPVNETIAAKIASVDPTVDPATRTFRCRFEIENEDRSLPAGFTVRLVAPSESDSLLSVR